MRFCMILALVLAGCTLGGGKLAKPSDSANPITGDAIEVTALDAPAGATDPAKPAVDAAKPAPGQVEPGQVEPGQVEPGQVEPGQVEPGQVEPGQADPAAVKPAETASPPVAEPPARVLGPEELACVKKGGRWSVAGKAGGMSCIHMMRDAGKSCHKKSDCEGDCLARSNTCAPVAPLFGCNEILQDNGVMVTLCID